MRRAACGCKGRSTVGDAELTTAASLSPQQWEQANASPGRVQKLRLICKAIRTRGLATSLRCQAWPMLLGCYAPDETLAVRQAANDLAQQELALLLQQAAAPDAHTSFDLSSGGETWEQNVRRIATDVSRTDCGPSENTTAEERDAISSRLTQILTAYAYSDPAVGYCQGMSDILSPFLVVFPDSDALAYMCFSALMTKIRQNFLEGQPGVHTSIQHIGSLLQRVDKKLWRQIDVLDMSTGVFAFRMLVCQFRRELMFGDIFDFWERLWAAERLADCQLKEHCVAALLRLHKKQIMRLRSPEDFIQFVNKDIVPIDGPATVNAAYKLWKQSGKQLPPPAASTKWTKLSKAEVLSTKNPDSLTVQAEAVGKDVST